ncbi:MAG: flagellar motor switch protein FliG [Spirochaetales bacterium]|nr:flagellar motor switch protein FliG [Spirochaetales bacterium]
MNMKDRLDRAYGGKKPEDDKAPQPGSRSEAPQPTSVAPKRDPREALSDAARAPRAKPADDGGRVSKSGPSRKPGSAAKTDIPPKKARSAAETADAGSLLKTGPEGVEKAAKFLLLLGQDEAAKVIKHLKSEEVERVSRAIAAIDHIGTAEANEILTEFGWLVKTRASTIEGGAAVAEAMLAAAFGDEKARQVIRKAAPEASKPFAFLADRDHQEIFALLKDESPTVMSVILPWLEPKVASRVIQALPDAARVEVVRRIAMLEKVDPDTLRRVEEAAREKARRIGSSPTEEIDGRAALADILRHVQGGLDEEILGRLDEADPALSEDIRERLFTLDDILRVRNRDVQASLRELSERQIATVLKGKSQAFRDKLLSNVSQSRRIVVMEEYDILGSVRRDEAEKATREFLGWFKTKWDAGDLVLEGDDELVD